MNFIELRKVAEKEIDKYLPAPLTKIVMEYFLKTVALCYRTKKSDVICYKAMDLSEWENLVEKTIRGKIPYISDDCLDPLTVLENTRVLTSERLVTALEYLSPHYLGNDIDMFEPLITGNSFFDEDGDDKVIILENIWRESEDRTHIARIGGRKLKKPKRKNK